MINPLCWAPPSELRYAGNSGISILKEAENKKEDAQSNPNRRVYNGASVEFIIAILPISGQR
jgi:hypothetical protein